MLTGNGSAVSFSPKAPSHPAAPLTPRELQILHLISKGYQISGLAGALYLSPLAVAAHVANVLEKLGARTWAQAVAHAYDEGLLPIRHSVPPRNGAR